MTAPVTPARITEASKTLANAEATAVACRKASLPFYVACALLEKESGGRNVYGGHDANGALSGFPQLVNAGNFEVFRWLVLDKGQTSNGVGPCQITYKGYFTQMEAEGLKPWAVEDNRFFGFRILKANHDHIGQWMGAGAQFNGSPRPNRAALDYGRDFAAKVVKWQKRLGIS